MPTPRMCSLGGIWKGLHPAEAAGLSHSELCSIWVLQQMGPGQPLALIGVRLGSVPRPVGTAAVFPLVVTWSILSPRGSEDRDQILNKFSR